jgi:hypothetical protein
MKRPVPAFVALAALALLRGAPAGAQENAAAVPPELPQRSLEVAQAAPPPPEEPASGTVITTSEESSPDYAAIGGGALVFAGAYVSSVIVGSASAHPGDGHLFLPVVGPWVDLADRHCTPGISCGTGDDGNKALLIVDGVAQDVGLLAVAAGLVFPEHRIVTTIAELRFEPTIGPGLCGVRASGVF